MKKGLKISLFVILGLISVFLISEVGIGAILANRNINYYKTVKPLENDLRIENKNGIDTFIINRPFKILQLTDTHIGGGIASGDNDHLALKAITSLIIESKPDLVTITGDLVFPSKFLSSNNDNLKALKILANTMEALNVYWAPVFGNHDSQKGSKYSRKELGDFLESLDYCLFKCGTEDIDGVGNYVINIENNDGEIIQSLYFMDTNDYVSINGEEVSALDNDYDHIHENQVKWYENQIKTINQVNIDNGFNEVVNSLLFIHIPFIEYELAYSTKDILFGKKNERNCPGPDYGMFDKMVELQSTKGVFCGHDHTNNYSVMYEGIQLTYGMSIDYLAYVYTRFTNAHRGGTEISIDLDSKFEIKHNPYK